MTSRISVSSRQPRAQIRQPFGPKQNSGNPNPLPPPVEHRFRPGQSGNPAGRPKLASHAYLKWLAHVGPDGLTNAQHVARAVVQRALAGDITAAREVRLATKGRNLTLDLTKLTTEQLERVARGEDPRAVVASIDREEQP